MAYVAAPVCAPSRSCLASAREYDAAGVMSNFANDYPVNQTTFYAVLRANGYVNWHRGHASRRAGTPRIHCFLRGFSYHTMTTGKDDLTKASQLGSKIGYPGCPNCRDGDGQYHLKELGFSDALRYSGKMDVVDQPNPHEMYGKLFLQQTQCFSRRRSLQALEFADLGRPRFLPSEPHSEPLPRAQHHRMGSSSRVHGKGISF